VILVVVLEVLQRLLGLFEDVLTPVEQLEPEVLALTVAHERFAIGRPVDLVEGPNALTVLEQRFVGSTVLAFHRLHEPNVPYSALLHAHVTSSPEARPYTAAL